MANSYKNIVITPNTGSSTGDPTVVFSGGNTTVNTDITLRVYPDSNGTLSFEGAAGQLFSITNDLSNSIFSVNDVSGIPLIEVNVSSQQITLGEFYGNVGVGKSSSTSSIYKLDVNGTINASNVLINGSSITGVANLTPANGYVNTSTTAANNYAGFMANSANGYATTINDANLIVARAYTNTSVGAANNYAGAMANSGNAWTQTIVDANLVTARAYTNTSTTAANNYAGAMANSANSGTGTAANNYAGVMANSVNAYANTLGTNTALAYSWTNTHTFSANVFYRNTSNIVWITNSASTVSNVSLRNYPDSNGTLSFEGSAGQLFSITNDLTGSIFAVNDVSGIPLIEVNVASQQITLGQFYGNVGIGTGASNSSIYKLDVIGSANISSPTLLVAGQNVIASFASINAYSQAVGTAGNTYATTVGTSGNAYAVTVGTAANNYAGAMSNAANARADTKVSSVSGTSGRITSSGGTTPAIDLASGVISPTSATGGISAVTVDTYGRVTAVTGSAGYVTSSGVTSVATGTGLTGGTITSTGTLSVDFATVATATNTTAAFAAANGANVFANTTYVRKAGDTITGDLTVQGNLTTSGVVTYANTQTLLIGDALITLNNDIPIAVAPSEDAGIEVKRGSSANVALLWNEGSDRWTFTNDGTNYRLIASNTDVESANNYAGAMANAANVYATTINDANTVVARAYTNTSTTAANTYAQAVGTAGNTYAQTVGTSANNYAGAMANSANARADTKVSSVTGTSGRITSSGGMTPAIDLASGVVTPTAATGGISALTVDTYGRVTAITGSAGYATTTQLNSYLPLAGGTMTGLIIGRTSAGANTSVSNDGGALSVRGDATNAATISFHRPAAYAINMGLDIDNIFRIGGWSDGVNTYRLQLGTPGGTHTFNGTVSATTFSGAGTSLTGTASSLTAGAATNATNAAFLRQTDGTGILTPVQSITTSGARGTSLNPSTYNYGIFTEFKNSSLFSSTGNYSGLVTYAPWTGTAASTGDPSYQLLFSPSGINLTENPVLKIRAGIDSTWGSWSTIFHSNNFTVSSNSTARIWANTVITANTETIFLDLATSGVTAAAYSSGISAITVDAYGRVTSVTGSAGYATTGQLASYLPLSGGTLTGRVIQSASGFGVGTDDTINSRIDSGFWQTSNAQTANGWPESTASWYHLITSTHSNDGNYFSMQFAGDFFNSNALWYRATQNNGLIAWNRIWHSGNDGAGSGLDADTVDGLNPSTTSGAASRIVVADPNGYIFNNYFNSTDDISSGTITYIMAKFGDNYYRSATAAKVASFLGSQSFASPTFTGTVNMQAAIANYTLTDAANIAWDLNTGQVATVTLAGNRIFNAPTNLRVGTFILHILQDGVGGRTLSWNSIFKWPAGVAPVLTTTASRRDIISFVCDGTNMYGSFLPDVR